MRLRFARPLTEDEWNRVVAALKRGPSPEQVRAMKRARERTAHLFPEGREDRAG